MNQQAESVAAAVPDHVDPALVVDFDFFDDRRYAEAGHPHDGLLKLRAETGRGIFWSPRNGGHWFITDHEMLFEAARTPEIFSSEYASFPPTPRADEPYLPPITMDGAEHAKYRLPLMRAFAPAEMKALEGDIRAFAGELIDAIVDHGRCDFVEMIGEPLPITMFMKLMGYDLSRRKQFRNWASWMTKADVEKRLTGNRNAMEMSRVLLDERRIARKDDLLSKLLDVEIDGRPITQAELDGMIVLLFGAGLDTVANSMAFGCEHLARNPALQDRLRADPGLIPEAVEEMLRRYAVSCVTRSAKRDTIFHGAQLKAGERVLLLLPLGNLDGDTFPNPERFDPERDNKAHMTFNSGPHRCVGSHLARVEIVVLWQEWLKRMPNIRLDPDQPAIYRPGIVFEISTLPIRWDVPGDRR
jgi:cytochrome P450